MVKTTKIAEKTAKETFEKGSGIGSSRDKSQTWDVKENKTLDFLSDNNIMSSKNEARRAIANNGLKINNNLINDEKNYFSWF